MTCVIATLVCKIPQVLGYSKRGGVTDQATISCYADLQTDLPEGASRRLRFLGTM